MTDEFLANILQNGETGKTWLDSIPSIIKTYEKKWHIKVGEPFYLTWNYVAKAKRDDGEDVVLKIGFPTDREILGEIDALQTWHGQGSEKLLEVDRESKVMLLERVKPGIPLSTMEDDEKATRILATVIKKLWKPIPENHTFITAHEWAKGITELKEKFGGTTGPLPSYLVDKAEELFQHLTTTSKELVLTHGDLHHDNVLSSDREEWLVIDPKGIAAEKAYETAAMIRNPYNKMKNKSNLENILRRRIAILSEELEISQERIYQWCLAQTVLSAVWSADSKENRWEHAIHVAEVLDEIKI